MSLVAHVFGLFTTGPCRQRRTQRAGVHRTGQVDQLALVLHRRRPHQDPYLGIGQLAPSQRLIEHRQPPERSPDGDPLPGRSHRDVQPLADPPGRRRAAVAEPLRGAGKLRGQAHQVVMALRRTPSHLDQAFAQRGSRCAGASGGRSVRRRADQFQCRRPGRVVNELESRSVGSFGCWFGTYWCRVSGRRVFGCHRRASFHRRRSAQPAGRHLREEGPNRGRRRRPHHPGATRRSSPIPGPERFRFTITRDCDVPAAHLCADRTCPKRLGSLLWDDEGPAGDRYPSQT